MASVFETAFVADDAPGLVESFGASGYYAAEGASVPGSPNCTPIVVPSGASILESGGTKEMEYRADVYVLASEITPARYGQFTVDSLVWTIEAPPESMRIGFWHCQCVRFSRYSSNERRMSDA